MCRSPDFTEPETGQEKGPVVADRAIKVLGEDA